MGFIGLASLLEEKMDALSLEIFKGLIPHKAFRYTLGRAGAQKQAVSAVQDPIVKKKRLKRSS